jgi:hypothetical protein
MTSLADGVLAGNPVFVRHAVLKLQNYELIRTERIFIKINRYF